jgi:transcriptional regulator of aromatic amino acid metabolism
MPGDTKPHLARQEKKRARRPKPGTVKQLSAVLWRAITHLEEHLDTTASAETVDTGELCKLTHALSQSASTYLKAVEVGELEARFEALEKVQGLTQDTPGRWAA